MHAAVDFILKCSKISPTVSMPQLYTQRNLEKQWDCLDDFNERPVFIRIGIRKSEDMP